MIVSSLGAPISALKSKTFLVLGMLLLANAFVGCASVKPTSNELFGHTIGLEAPVFKRPLGALELMKDGRWALMWAPDAQAVDLGAGQLVALGDLDQSFRHIFQVVEPTSWGAFVRRLDTDPLRPRISGNIVPLPARLDPASADRWRICQGSGPMTQSPCVDAYPDGTLFRVFPREYSGFAKPSAVFRAGDPLSFRGMIDGDWIALPAGFVPAFRESRVASDGCDLTGSNLDVVPFEVPNTLSPLKVEELAFEAGVDALLKCESGKVVAHIPFILRASLYDEQSTRRSPPYLAAQPLSAPDVYVREVAELAAALGAGDHQVSTFILGTLDTKLNEILERGAEIPASVRDIDLALFLSASATQGAWNPEQSVGWTLAHSRVHGWLDNTGEATRLWMKIPEMIKAGDRPSSMGWVLWTEFLNTEQKGTQGSRENLALSASKIGADWEMAMAVYIGLTKDPAILDQTQSSFSDRERWKAVVPDAKQSRALDVYGRSFSGASAEKLGRVGYSAWRVPFETPDSFAGALMARKFGQEVDLSRFFEDGLKVECEEIGRLHALALHKESADDQSFWLVSDALPAACSSDTRILEMSPPAEDAQVFYVILMRLVQEGRIKVESYATLVDFAKTPGEVCEQWTLADAFRFTADGEFQDATDSLGLYQQCSTRSMEDAATQLRLLVDFMQTLRLTVMGDSKLTSAVQAVLGQDAYEGCVGKKPLEYDLRELIPTEVQTLVPSTLIRAKGEILQDAATMLAEAGSESESLRAQLGKPYAVEQLKALDALEKTFARLGHQSGIARVRFLQAHGDKTSLRKLSAAEREQLEAIRTKGFDHADETLPMNQVLCTLPQSKRDGPPILE